jgi:hypothetical protein
LDEDEDVAVVEEVVDEEVTKGRIENEKDQIAELMVKDQRRGAGMIEV